MTFMINGPYFRQRLADGAHPIDLGFELLELWPTLDGRVVNDSMGYTQLGDDMSESAGCDGTLFAAWFGHLYVQHDPNDHHFFACAYLAYALALGRTVQGDLIIVHPWHEQVIDLQKIADGPFDLRCVYMVRDVDVVFASAMRTIMTVAINEGGFGHSLAKLTLGGLYNNSSMMGLESVDHDRPPDPRLADRCVALRLEDLRVDLRGQMEALLCWLDIPWSDKVLTSTVDGKKWWNRISSPRSNGPIQGLEAQRLASISRITRFTLLGISQARRRRWRYGGAVSTPWRWAAAATALIPLTRENSVVDFASGVAQAVGRWGGTTRRKWLGVGVLTVIARISFERLNRLWAKDISAIKVLQDAAARGYAEGLSSKETGWRRWTCEAVGRACVWVIDLSHYIAVRRLLWRALRQDAADADKLVTLLIDPERSSS